LSLSHGLFSKIVLFSKCYKQNICPKLSKELLEDSIQFLLNCKNPIGSVSVFPSRIIEKSKTNFSRLSWCYGDLGISIALWQAGEALQNKEIKREAIDICLQTTKRFTQEETGIEDLGFCHGTAGIAHIYNRMWRYTGIEEFKTAYDYWIQETLKMAKYKDGLAGYKSYKSEEFGGWKNDYGLLEGIAGIGLVLHSYLHPEEEPHWDRCLLLS
jgi:lantibiotic modifying enzyme